MESALSVKGQVTIPKEAREYLNLKPGDRVKFFKHPDGHIVILPTVSVTVLKGMVPLRRATPATLEEIGEGIAAGAVEDAMQGMEHDSKQLLAS